MSSTPPDPAPESEFAAIQAVHAALEPLSQDGRGRVLQYIVSLLGVAAPALKSAAPVPGLGGGSAERDSPGSEPNTFGTFAELFEAARPTTQADKALLAGYWLQTSAGVDSFDGQSANKELKHLGEGLLNVTSALDQLKDLKPALAIQLRKSGTSRQARKVYKITHAGEKAVAQMIGNATA